MLSVDLDGMMLGKHVATIERYTFSLANHLIREIEGSEVRVFTQRRRRRFDRRIQQYIVGGPARLASKWISARPQGEGAIYHLPYFPDHTSQIFPFASAHRSLMTMHDLSFFHFPYLSEVERERQMRRFELSLRWTDAIIADSHSVRNDILSEFDLPEEKIEVVYPGIDEHFSERSPDDRLKAVKKKYNLPGKTVLTVGRDYKHKNYPSLIEGFAGLLRDNLKDTVLVMVGAATGGEETEKIRKMLRREGLAGHVRRIGRVSDGELAALYQLADVYVCPSLNEGFPFAVLEAMASGTAAVAVSRTAVPEVCGEAALLVREGTPTAIAREVRRLLDNEEERSALARAGRLRAEQFSWGKAAADTHLVYARVLKEGSPREVSDEEREGCWDEFHELAFEELADRLNWAGAEESLSTSQGG